MRVLHINSARKWSGGEVHTITLCKKLIKLGCDITIACRPNSILRKICINEDIKILNTKLVNSVDFLSVIQISIFCRKNKIDIIHVHLARDYWIAYFVQKLYPHAKIILTRHLTCPINNIKSLYNNVNTIIAVSHAVKEVIKKQNIFPESKIRVIHNGIDIEKYSTNEMASIRAELGIKNDEKIIGIVGRIAHEKGQKTLIKSIPQVIQHFPNTKFLLIGSDTQNNEYIKKLKILVENLEISEKVEFLGFRDDIPNLLKNLDIFIMASKHEPFGLVTAEALAAGIPVVSTNTGGSKEIIIDGQSGILIPPNNEKALATAIIEILSNPDLATQLSKNGKERSKMFSSEIMAHKTLDIYKEALTHEKD